MNECEKHRFDGMLEGEPPQCETCRAEAARLTDSLANFRNAMDSWSAREFRPVRPAVDAMPYLPPSWARWSAVFALLIVIAIIPFYRHEQTQRRLASSRADTELLRQVDADLSEDVSPAMEPLLRMAAWDARTSNTDLQNKSEARRKQ